MGHGVHRSSPSSRAALQVESYSLINRKQKSYELLNCWIGEFSFRTAGHFWALLLCMWHDTHGNERLERTARTGLKSKYHHKKANAKAKIHFVNISIIWPGRAKAQKYIIQASKNWHRTTNYKLRNYLIFYHEISYFSTDAVHQWRFVLRLLLLLKYYQIVCPAVLPVANYHFTPVLSEFWMQNTIEYAKMADGSSLSCHASEFISLAGYKFPCPVSVRVLWSKCIINT